MMKAGARLDYPLGEPTIMGRDAIHDFFETFEAPMDGIPFTYNEDGPEFAWNITPDYGHIAVFLERGGVGHMHALHISHDPHRNNFGGCTIEACLP